ncbi:MAG TPA: DUF4406 domain-containing protein [Acidimicrobiales bacterium]
MKPLVYVAGPITGNPWGCVRQATDAFAWLRDAGCVPFLPQLSVLHEMVAPMSHDEWLAYNLDMLAHCDAIVRLPGGSPGADREVAHATALGLPVFLMTEDSRDIPVAVGALRSWAAQRVAA